MSETPNPNYVDSDTLTGEMRPIRRVVIGLGSNLGERFSNLQGAVDALADTPNVWVTGVSPVYETEPVDCPPDAKKFLNAVVLADTTLSAHRLLDRALEAARRSGAGGLPSHDSPALTVPRAGAADSTATSINPLRPGGKASSTKVATWRGGSTRTRDRCVCNGCCCAMVSRTAKRWPRTAKPSKSRLRTKVTTPDTPSAP